MKQKFYAVKNKNNKIRVNSSSGGVFYNLAAYVIENGGSVYGAVYNKNNDVVHYKANTIEDISKFFGSKYTQSDFTECLKLIKLDLENNKLVLFSGTPCQINTIKKITDDNQKKLLILVDVICYGTPNKKFFCEYKAYMEEKYKSKIVSINMRYKKEKTFLKNLKRKHISFGATEPHYMKIIFANGKSYIEKNDYDVFYYFFDYFKNITCYKCPFSKIERVSDITIGDFHEFNCKLNDFNDGNGVSLVIVNTDTGENIFNNCKKNFDLLEKKLEECLQPALCGNSKVPLKYNDFQNDYDKYGFEYIVKKYFNHSLKFKIKRIFDKIGLLNILKVIKRKIK